MSTEKVLIDNKSDNSEELEVLLEAIAKSSNRRKILVGFKFKNTGTEYREWLTYKQYHAFRTIDCLEFCRTIT